MNALSLEVCALMCLPGMTNSKARELFDTSLFKNVNLEAWTGVSPADADAARALALSISTKCEKAGIGILTALDAEFPDSWQYIKPEFGGSQNCAPLILFYRGNIDLLKTKSVAVVGNRNISNKAASLVTTMTFNLIQEGYTITSGLADGTDTVAHMACVMNNGKTIAILGNDLSMEGWYWPNNKVNFAKDILNQEGLLISEYNFGVAPCKETLVYRNRLQCCLGESTLIGAMKNTHCGTMHTVRYALANDRKVYALTSSEALPDFAGNVQLINKGSAKEVEL